MNIEQLKAALAAKMQRKAELEKLISGGEDEQERDETKLAALVEEAKTIVPEINKLQADLRSALQAEASEAFKGVNPMEPVNKPQERNNTMTTKQKLSLMLAFAARKKALDPEMEGADELAVFLRANRMPQSEQRALDTSLTTTATTFVAASANADGVNNGGIFIKTSVLLDLLREEGKLTPILQDIVGTNIPGLTVFPYRESRGSANGKKEGAKTNDDQMKWNKLELVRGVLQIVIKVTDELEDLTDFDFGAYLAEQIIQDLTEDWSAEFIYGIGTADAAGASHIAGITYNVPNANKITIAANASCAVSDIENAVKKLVGSYRRGAKIYVSQSVYDTLCFSKDSHGDYILPVINGGNGVRSFGNLPVELDETLHAGEVVIGNVAKYYKVNFLRPLRVEKARGESGAVTGITTYVANEHCAAKAVAGAFVWIYQATA